MKKIEDLKGLSFAKDVRGIEIYDHYFTATEGYGNMATYYSIDTFISIMSEYCDPYITDLELDDKGEIIYLYGYFSNIDN